jgi:hypothetical protein
MCKNCYDQLNILPVVEPDNITAGNTYVIPKNKQGNVINTQIVYT